MKCLLTAICLLTMDRLVQANTSSRLKARQDLETNPFRTQTRLLFDHFLFPFCSLFFCLLSISLCVPNSFWVLAWDRIGSSKRIWQDQLSQTWISPPNKLTHPAWYWGWLCVLEREMMWGCFLNPHSKWENSSQNMVSKFRLLDFLERNLGKVWWRRRSKAQDSAIQTC